MSQNPTNGAAGGNVTVSVSHLIENADVRVFSAWAAGLVSSEPDAVTAGGIYFGTDSTVPLPNGFLAISEDGPSAQHATIRCLAFFFGDPAALDLRLITERLTLLWTSSGAGQAHPAGSHPDLLHATVEKFVAGNPDGITAHPHVPWVITAITNPTTAATV
jgi:hypothetical protein